MLGCLGPLGILFYKLMSSISFRKALVISSSNMATTPFINACYIFYMYPIYILTSCLCIFHPLLINIFSLIDSSDITCSFFISNLSNIKQTKPQNPSTEILISAFAFIHFLNFQCFSICSVTFMICSLCQKF